jgi:hypothetical protein
MILLEIFLAKIKGREVVHVCKVTISKVEDFDKAMHVVQVRVRKLGMKDVVLDEGFRINIICKEFRKKLGLRMPQLAPFMVCMLDNRKIQPIGLIRNLKIDLARCSYKISIIVLIMEEGKKTYSMLLGRPHG